MSARNLQELGKNLQKIVTALLSNEDLVRLLYFTDADPLNKELHAEEWSKINLQDDIYEKLLKIVPKVGTKDNAKSIVAVYVSNATALKANAEFQQVKINIDIYTPLTQWIIKDSNLRPFAIMGQIENSLNGKTVNGMGKLKCGDFNLILLTEDTSCYQMKLSVVEYE